jgi:hypothetical protein
MAMYVLKGKPQIVTPYSSETSGPQPTNIGMGNLSPDVSCPAKFGLDCFTGARAKKKPIPLEN